MSRSDNKLKNVLLPLSALHMIPPHLHIQSSFTTVVSSSNLEKHALPNRPTIMRVTALHCKCHYCTQQHSQWYTPMCSENMQVCQCMWIWTRMRKEASMHKTCTHTHLSLVPRWSYRCEAEQGLLINPEIELGGLPLTFHYLNKIV